MGLASPFSFHRLLGLALLGLTAWTGCADNAVLEVSVTYPPAPCVPGMGTIEDCDLREDMWVRAQAQSAGFGDIGLRWMGVEYSDPVSLGDSESDVHKISIVATGDVPDGASEDLVIKFLFCRTSSCEADTTINEPIAAEVWARVESPFYRGKSTALDLVIDAVPQCRSCTTNTECAVMDELSECTTVDPENGPCQCENVGTNMQNQCYYNNEPSQRSCIAAAPTTASTDDIQWSVALSMEAEPVWQVEISKCKVKGCLMGSPTTYCSFDGVNRVHECERD